MEKWEKIGFFSLVGHPRFTGRWCPSRCPRIFSQSVIVYILVFFIWTPAIYWSLLSQSQSRQNISISISALKVLTREAYLSSPRPNFSFLPPATKLRQGNVFTPVCHSVHRGGCLATIPKADTPSWTDTQAQTPPWADTPRQTLPQVDPPLGRHPCAQCMLGNALPLPSTCWDTHPHPVHAGIHPPPAQCMLGYGHQSGGTHPTGMFTCHTDFR